MNDNSKTATDREGQDQAGPVYVDPDPGTRYPFLCTRPGATATWAEYLAADKIQRERYAVSEELWAAYEADPGNEEKKRAWLDYEPWDDGNGGDTTDITGQYVVIRTAEERAELLTKRLAGSAEAGVSCQWRHYLYDRNPAASKANWEARCERPATVFLEDPAAPDLLFCDEHAATAQRQIQADRAEARYRAEQAERAARYARSSRGLTEKARELDGQAAGLERKRDDLRDAEESAARLAELAAGLAAAGRCGTIIRHPWTSQYITGTPCPLAAGHDGGCKYLWAVPPEGESSAETERELAEIQAQAAQAREQAEQAAQAEEAEREQDRAENARQRAEATRKARAARERFLANLPEPGSQLAITHHDSHWEGSHLVRSTRDEVLTIAQVYQDPDVTLVRVTAADGGEQFLITGSGESWGRICGAAKVNGKPCRNPWRAHHQDAQDGRCGTHSR